MAYKRQYGITKITCDACNASDMTDAVTPGQYFVALGWSVDANNEKQPYQFFHYCPACIAARDRNQPTT